MTNIIKTGLAYSGANLGNIHETIIVGVQVLNWEWVSAKTVQLQASTAAIWMQSDKHVSRVYAPEIVSYWFAPWGWWDDPQLGQPASHALSPMNTGYNITWKVSSIV